MKDEQLFPTICGYHWIPVFAAPPRINKISEQIRKHCGEQVAPTPDKGRLRGQASAVGDAACSRTNLPTP